MQKQIVYFLTSKTRVARKAYHQVGLKNHLDLQAHTIKMNVSYTDMKIDVLFCVGRQSGSMKFNLVHVSDEVDNVFSSSSDNVSSTS